MPGLPDNANIQTYNGFAKVNYQALPPSNPLTDWDNPSLGQCTSDVAGLTQTGCRFMVQMTLAATTGALVLVQYQAVWKNATSTLPVLARTTTGVFTITNPTLVSDEYQASIGYDLTHTVNLTMPVMAVVQGSTVYHVQVTPTSGNVTTVYVFDSSSAASDAVGATIVVGMR